MVNGAPAIIGIDRVPCVGEYISGANGLFRVMAVVFIPNNVQVHVWCLLKKTPTESRMN